ncbi:MAG: PDZ domain-containing protein [Planctomycetota bacterium]|nr:MAG: PDZ domain-containing protein [Planctomycetota bacterium]
MSFRLLRTLIVLVGLAALGGFGWRFYDFVQHRAELLGRFDLAGFRASIPVDSAEGQRIHLKPFEEYRLLAALNVTGILPVETGPGNEPPPPPPPLVGPGDLRLVFLSLGQVPMAYLSPTDPGPAPAQPGAAPVQGGLYTVGDRFELPAKKGVELELVAIRDDEVEIGIVGQEDGNFLLRREVATADLDRIRADADTAVVRRQFPARTTAVGGNTYEVGTDDLAELQQMSEDQLLASVSTKPKYGADGKPIGQRVTRLKEDSPFRRFGLRENDVVLDVNGIPAGDRAALLRRLKAMKGVEEVTVRVERLGSVRTYTYRIPPGR